MATVSYKNGKTRTYHLSLNAKGDGSKRVPFSSRTVKWVELTLVNASDRTSCWSDPQGTFSCWGTPKDDNLVQKMRGVASGKRRMSSRPGQARAVSRGVVHRRTTTGPSGPATHAARHTDQGQTGDHEPRADQRQPELRSARVAQLARGRRPRPLARSGSRG